jgi:hypothetical protein
MLIETLIGCLFHVNFRNGVNTELAKEEFVGQELPQPL